MQTFDWNKAIAQASWMGMSRRSRTATIAASLATLGFVAGSAFARSPVPEQIQTVVNDDGFGNPHGLGNRFGNSFGEDLSFGAQSGPFTMSDAPLGEPGAPASSRPGPVLAGSAIANFSDGLLVVDADSGMLLRIDRGSDTATAQLDIGVGVSQLVVHPDGRRAFVVDRRHDEIVVVDLSSGLSRVDAYRTRAEPFGVSLTPDGSTLLVTTVADRSLSALDLATGLESWTLEIGPEPRGVAVSPDGREALVTFLTTGAVARVVLGGATQRASYVSLDAGTSRSPVDRARFVVTAGASRSPGPVDRALSDEGRSFARNAFAVGYVGHGLAVVPHQLSTPHLAGEGRVESSGYGGGDGFVAPISHRLAFLDTPDKGEGSSTRVAMASLLLHQPRALAYDARVDTLYVAGYGSDNVLAIANVSQASARGAWTSDVAVAGEACGPSGVTVDGSTGDIAVWCSLSQRVVWLGGATTDASPSPIRHTEQLANSHLSSAARRGRAMFRSGNNNKISTGGAMACSSCHAEVRADGLSWRLQGNNLQTPFLAGRLEGAHPFKWDGMDPTLHDSLINTVRRLGGSGITSTEAADIAAFLKTVDAPRVPTVDDIHAVARGQALFSGEVTGCATCHSGPLMTDQQSYDLTADLGKVDTPSLVGLATSAPYYHDGSAATLDALLRGNANVHGMGRISKLSDVEIHDLVQYLKTL